MNLDGMGIKWLIDARNKVPMNPPIPANKISFIGLLFLNQSDVLYCET